jgi:glycogen operon protein
VSRFASRLLASPDLYGHEEREPEQSINFVTCHDGFTLNDLVSYDRKHNEDNGEDNRDGADENLSWNCGAEGPTEDPAVERLRSRQAKNLLALTLLSIGTPMILMGDEVRRTQRGNNNAYCQDGEVSWLDWRLLERHADVLRFVSLLLAARLKRDLAVEDPGLTLNQFLNRARLEWHGIKPGQPDWGNESHSVALTAWSLTRRFAVHLIVNAWREPLTFELPAASQSEGCRWLRWIDTSLASPDDIVPPGAAPAIEDGTYRLPPHSAAVLLARPLADTG